MNFRQAVHSDLPQLQEVYRKIIDQMNENQIQIWDEIYPCTFFQEDIRAGRLFVLTEGPVIAGAFALCTTNHGAQAVRWASGGEARYLDRLGVNAAYLRRGVGSLLVKKAVALAGEQGADALRLFVVDCNLPAIRLYEKNGLQRADGIYVEQIDEDLSFREFGYEICTAKNGRP